MLVSGRYPSEHEYAGQDASGAVAFNLPAGNVRVSRNFRLAEFAPNEGDNAVIIHPATVEVLQRLRTEFGPLVVTSGYRTVSYNRAIGGASRSAHLDGLAADIKPVSASLRDVARRADEYGVGGLGQYSTFLHIDTRGYGRRWRG